MTDKETIKALEYCTNESDGECKECEYDKYCPRCVPKLLEDALDLIKRQQAEIERLEAEEEKYPFKCVMPFNSMICSKSIEDYDRLINDIEVDAIKGFVDRWKEKHKYKEHELCGYRLINGELDDLVKEYEERE